MVCNQPSQGEGEEFPEARQGSHSQNIQCISNQEFIRIHCNEIVSYIKLAQKAINAGNVSLSSDNVIADEFVRKLLALIRKQLPSAKAALNKLVTSGKLKYNQKAEDPTQATVRLLEEYKKILEDYESLVKDRMTVLVMEKGETLPTPTKVGFLVWLWVTFTIWEGASVNSDARA